MRMKEMLKEYQQGRIEKKLYWTMMREKLKVLTEIQEMLLNSTECESVQIRKQDIIQENSAGVKMYYDFSQPVCRAEAELYLASDPESESMEFVSRNLNDDAVVFDIGANVGLYSLNLYRRNRNARFYAFEPLPETFKNLERTVALNEVSDSRITCFNIGFSDRGGVLDFYLPPESEAASLQPVNDAFYLRESNEHGEYSGRQKMDKVPCEVHVLDLWCKEHQIERIDFIKIDVEGNEKYVLEGAGHVLAEYKPMVYCELLRKHARRFGYHPNDVIGYMKNMGYDCVVINNGSVIRIDAVDDTTKETNFFFLHRKRHVKILES